MTEEVDLSHLTADIASIATKAKTVNEKNGELRQLIKSKIDKRGYNSVALGMLRRIANMSDDKFADFRRTFVPGLDQVIADREGQLPPEMDFDSEPGEPAEENEVVPFDTAAE